jgi:CRP-like cAMP-binding protein
LRKVARLFSQKVYDPGEMVFKQGEPGQEVFVVQRGVIELYLEGKPKPIADMINGQIFGELAFLDGGPRIASARVRQPSILLVIQRSAFTELTQREPHFT